jgi:hypothetical protein
VTVVAVRTHALARLVAALELACPALKDRITVEADRDEAMKWPKLGVRMVRAPFKAYDRRKVVQDAGATVFDVGHFAPLVQLRLGAPTQRQRVDLGEQLLGAFLGTGYRPGILVTDLPECFGTVAAWELDDEGWNDEMAFDKKFWSVMTLSGWIPALVRVPTYTLSDLRIAFTEDMTSTTPAVETVRVNEDGTLTKVP